MQEPVCNVSSRHSTRSTATEHAIAMARAPAIQRISDEARHDSHEQRDELPAGPEATQDAHDGIGIRVTLLAFEQQERQWIDRIDAVLDQQLATALCLH